MTDNRTNDPTEAQVEAACKAHEFTNAFGPERETRMRAALVAAAGAAPQAPAINANCMVDADGCEAGTAPQAVKDVHEPSHDRVYCVRCGGSWPCQPAPVQPSSTVDEDVLMLVIEKELLTDTTVSDEWSDFKVEKTAERITRAVVEAIGGEGR